MKLFWVLDWLDKCCLRISVISIEQMLNMACSQLLDLSLKVEALSSLVAPTLTSYPCFDA